MKIERADPRCEKGKGKRGREELTMAFGVGERRRVGACVRGDGVRQCVGVRGAVRRRRQDAMRAGEQEEERAKEEEMNAEGAKICPLPPIY